MDAAKSATMNQITKRLELAVATIAAMPVDQQDLIAIEMLDRARALSEPPVKLTLEVRADLEAALAAARRGERASDAEVAAMIAKYGL